MKSSPNQKKTQNNPPWGIHLQKLALELNCPLCLSLLNQPILLPCNHIFCSFCVPRFTQIGSECPACKQEYVDREVRPAPFLENIITVYQNLDATLNVDLPQSTSYGKVDECASQRTSRKQGTKASVISRIGTAVNLGDDAAPSNSVCIDDMEEQSPRIGDTKHTDGLSSNPGSNNGTVDKHLAKRSIGNGTGESGENLKKRCISGKKSQSTLDKGQKILNSESYGLGANINEHTQPQTLVSEKLPNSTPTMGFNLQNPLADGHSASMSHSLDAMKSSCAFCHSTELTEGTGRMMCYDNGKEVTGVADNFPKAIHVHEKCIAWTPQIFYEGAYIKNLEKEIARANKLKCASCSKKGAALGCYVGSCKKSYHVPCAFKISECRWDCNDFLLLCPKHATCKFPSEGSISGKSKTKFEKQANGKRTMKSGTRTMLPKDRKQLVFCGSALSTEEKCYLDEFSTACGALVSKDWRSNVTHVIAATDENGACKRTFKVLMAILNGRWILTTEWIKACLVAGGIVNEEPYEVGVDNHGCTGGPKAGRLRLSKNAPKLFDRMKFYFSGDFAPAFKNDILNLVLTAGGRVIESKENLLALPKDSTAALTTLVVYNSDVSENCMSGDKGSIKLLRMMAAENIAREVGSQVIAHSWILDSIAACCFQPLTCS